VKEADPFAKLLDGREGWELPLPPLSSGNYFWKVRCVVNLFSIVTLCSIYTRGLTLCSV
jgi:hypothetical protein